LNIALDVIVVVVAALFIFNGYKRGVVNILVHFFGSAISAIAAAVAGSLLAEHIYINFIQKKLIDFLTDCTPFEDLGVTTADIASGLVDNCPEYLRNILSMMNITKKDIAVAIGSSPLSAAELVEEMIRPATLRLITVILAIAVYTICVAVISIVTKGLTTAIDLSGLSTPNKIAGAVLGVLAALVIIMVLSFVLYILMVFLPEESSKALRMGIDHSFLYRYIYNMNVPDQIISVIINS